MMAVFTPCILLIISLIISVSESLIIPRKPQLEVSIGGRLLKIGPQFSETGKPILYTLDSAGTFHRYSPPAVPEGGEITYSVLKNGILAPTTGPYAISYEVTKQGDIVPKAGNKCVYKSDKAAFYIKGLQNLLIPVEIFYSGDRICYVYQGSLLFSEATDQPNRNQLMSLKVKPDKSCSGDITLFLLKSNGVFARNPPDEFLPNGMKLKYQLQEDGSLSPQLSRKSAGLELAYETAEDGNLKPCDTNTHTLTTTQEATKCYILGENGVIAPVSEVMGTNKTVSYFYDGHLIHQSNQFRTVFTNSSVVYLTERVKNTTEVSLPSKGPRFFCGRRKRELGPAYNGLEEEFEEKKPGKADYPFEVEEKPSRSTTTAFAYDDSGKRILLSPLVSDCGKVAIFKLSCKGRLIRMDPHEEPESGFPVYFKLLDNGILVPIGKPTSGKIILKYILQPNGSLHPVKDQKCTLKKAPACLTYFILGQNRELLPARLNILKSNHISVFYQDTPICTIDPCHAKDLEVFSNCFSPCCMIVNGKTAIIYSEQITKPKSGATWSNPNRSGENLEFPSKNLYLIGPNNTRIKIEPLMSSNNGITMYEMDCHGVCHKSPKDDNKNLGLRSFNILTNSILLQSNKTCRYIYLIDKQGNMLPCCYPETKLQAPHGLTVKYLVCKNGVFVPILLEHADDSLRFSYENHVIYSRRTYTIREIIERWGDCCTEKHDDDKYHKENGCIVYFIKKGDLFIRHPSKDVEPFMFNHTGCLRQDSKGSYIPVVCSTNHKMADAVEVRLLENGDLAIIGCTGKPALDGYYLLTATGALEPVEAVVKDGFIKFYKGGSRVAKQPCDCRETPGPYKPSDPLKIYEDSEPESKEISKGPQYMPLKFEDAKPSPWSDGDVKKCKQIRECMMQMVKKSPNCVNMDIDSSHALTRDIMNMMKICSKHEKGDLLTRVQRHLHNIVNFSDEEC